MAKTFNLTAQINLQGPTNIKPVVAQIRRELGSINTNLNIKFDSKAAKGVDAISQRMQNLNRILVLTNKNAQTLGSTLNTLGSSIKGLGSINKVASSVNNTNKSINNTTKVTKAATSQMAEFGKQSALAIRRFAAFSVVTTGVLSLANAIRVGTKSFIDFDKQLIRLQQVTGAGAVGIKALQDEITSLAINLGVSSESLTEVAVTLAQAGFSARETQQALAALAKTELAPSFDNLTDTTEGAIAAIRQFGIETQDLEKVLGSINAVAAAFAVESSDIITAIQRAGGAFAASSKGVSEGADALNEFIAVFTSVRATTRESAETIATGLRTIFTRIQRGSTIKFLEEFGIQLTDIEGKFVGPFEAVKRLSTVLRTLDPRDLRFSQIVEELGGFRQISKVIPLIQQFAESEKALAVAQRGQNSLSEAQVKAQQSLANQLARVREEFLALIRAVGQSQTFQALFKVVLGLTSGLIKLASVFKPILPLIAVLGAFKGASALTKFAGGFIKNIGGGGAGGTSTGGLIPPQGGPTGGSSSAAAATSSTKLADELISNTKSVNQNTTSLDNLTAAINNLKTSGGSVGFAKGGFVPGSGNRDTVPAMLTPGEFVIRKKAVEAIGANKLHKMNKYAYGGKVKDLSRYYKSIPAKKGYENLENQPIKDNSIFKEVKPTDLTTDQIEEWRGSDIPRWKKFEYVLSKNYNLGPPASEQFALLDFPQSRSEAKFMKKGDTYDDPDSIKGNNEATIAAKNFLYENSLLSGKANIKPDELITRAIANKPVTAYWADPAKFAAQGLNKGGLIQKFLRGGTVEETASLENMSLKDAAIAWIKKLGGIEGVKKTSNIPPGERTLNGVLRANNINSGTTEQLQAAVAAINKALQNQKAKKVREAQSINKMMKLGIVGLEPLGYSEDEPFDTKFGKAALLIRGLPNAPEYADAISQLSTGVSGLGRGFARKLQNASITKTKQLVLDFDKTLVDGADILGPDGKEDIPAYSDLKKVEESLKNGYLTPLGEKLKSLLELDPAYLDNIRVLTARPQNNANLLAKKLKDLGIPIPANKITGISGGNKGESMVSGETLIDDNIKNVMNAIKEGKGGKYYASQLRDVSDAEARAKGRANAEGAILELALSELGAYGGTIKENSVDFEQGLGLQAAGIFGIPPDILTEVKRTLSSAAIGRAKDQFTRYLDKLDTAPGIGQDIYGISKTTGLPISRFAEGGEVVTRGTVRYLKSDIEKAMQGIGLSYDDFFKRIPTPNSSFDQFMVGASGPEGIEFPRDLRPYNPKSKVQLEMEKAAAAKNARIQAALEKRGQSMREYEPRAKFAFGGPVKLYHGSNTGADDSVLKSFKEKGALSNIAQGYGQGAGFYLYTEKDKAIEQAKMRVGGGSGFTVAQGDRSGKPMVLSFNESLSPENYDLDYELQKNLVTQWLHDNFDKIKDKVAPDKGLVGIKDIISKDMSKGIMSSGIRVQSAEGSRKALYAGGDSDIRQGEILGQIMNRLQSGDPELVNSFESELFKRPLGLALKYVGASPLKPSNIETFAAGGGISGQDTVPALLTPGEFVINKKAAQKIGYGKLHKMNKADKLQGYNKGGIVGGIQKFADGGDVKATQDWADAIRLLSQTTIPDFRSALQDVANQVEALGKIDVAKALRDIASNANSSDDAVSRLGGSQRNANILKNNSILDTSGNVIDLRPGLEVLASVIEKNVKAQELFGLSAEQAGISVKEFEQNIKNQILERSLTGEAGRKSSRLDLRKEFVKTRLKFSPNDLRDADNQQQVRESLQSSLEGLLDPSELNDAIDEIIYGLGTGATSLEEIAKISPEVAKALDSARDKSLSLADAHKQLEDEMGALTDSVKVTAEEMQTFEYKKSGKAQQEFGLLGNMNPSGALAFKQSKVGGRLLGAAQNFMQTGGLGGLPIIGKGIGSLSKALENLPGPIGNAIKAVGGLPGAFAAVTSIIGSEVIPQLLKAANMGTSEIGAGIGGALAEGGSRAASMGALGAQIAGPIGAAVGVISGALSGAIQGFTNAFKTKKLENSLAKLNSSIENVDKAFGNLAEKDNIQNVIEAQKSLGGLTTSFKDLETQSKVSVGERLATGASNTILGTGATWVAGLGLIIGGTALGGASAVGTAATAGAAAPLGAAGVTAGGYMITAGGAMMIGSPAAGLAYGTATAALKGPDELDDEALQASLKAAEKYIEGLNQLAERDIKLQSLSNLEKTTKVIDQINKDLLDNKITSSQAEALKKAEFIKLGTQGASIENAQRSALINAGIDIRPDQPLAQQIEGNVQATTIAAVASENAAYMAGMAKLRRLYGENNALIRAEAAGRDEVVKMGREELGMREYQMASVEKLTRLTKDMAKQTEELAAAYTRALAQIGRFKDELENFVLQTGQSAALLTGEGGMGQVNRGQEQMLRNMTAYTAEELKPVLENVAKLAGGGEQAQKLTQSIQASKIMQQILPDLLRNTPGRDVGSVLKQLNESLGAAGIGESVRDTLVEEVRTYLERETGGRDTGSFQEVLDNFPALADAIDSTKKAQEVGVAILEAQNDALQAVNEQLDQYNKYLRQALQWSIRADTIRLEGAIALDRALGRDISLERLNAPFTNEIKRLTEGLGLPGGATTDPVEIAEGIRNNEARIRKIVGDPTVQGDRGLLGQAMNQDEKKAQEETRKLAQEQADLTRASADAYDALERLATNGDIAANILGKIEEERQQGKNVIDFVRRVSTQSSEDGVRMVRSFKAFDAAVKGNLNFRNRENRQLAYEGMDTLLPLLKGSETGNRILQRMTENMLIGQGVNIDEENYAGSGKTLRELIAAGTTGMDPGTQKLVALYQQAIGIQAEAATQLSNLNGTAARKHLAGTEHILKQLYQNLPFIIATALTKPDQVLAGQAQAPPLQLPQEPENKPVTKQEIIDQNQPVPVVIANQQNNAGAGAGAPINGQNIAGPVNNQIFNALSTSIPVLNTTILNNINSINILHNGVVSLKTSVDNLIQKLAENSTNIQPIENFGQNIELFGSKVKTFNEATISFGSYVDKLSGVAGQLSNAKITMGGNYTVDVRVSGAAAFQAIEESTQKLIDREIGLAMQDMINKIKKATGMNLDLNRREP